MRFFGKKAAKMPFCQKSFVTTGVTTTFWLRFGRKSAQIGQRSKNPKSLFFCVRRQKWCLSLQIRSVSAENRFAVLRIPFSALKSKLVTACHRFVTARFWCEKVRKVLRRVFRGPTARRGPGLERGSPPRFRPAARQPAELVTTPPRAIVVYGKM